MRYQGPERGMRIETTEVAGTPAARRRQVSENFQAASLAEPR